jgi:O-antigen/teichoic acid export membrane protein
VPEKNLQQYVLQIFRQSGIYFLGMVFTTVVGFFFKVYIARELGAEALGIYAMGLSIVAIVSGFSSIGLARSGIRFISQYKARRHWYFLRAYLQRTTLITLGLGSGLALLVYLLRFEISTLLFQKPEVAKYMIWFAVLIFLSSLHGLMEAYAQGFQNVGKQTIIGSFIKFPVKIGATIGLLMLGYGLTGYIIGEVLATFISLALFILLIWNLIPEPVKHLKTVKPIPWDKNLLSLSGVFLGLKILGMFSGEIDKLVLGGFMSASDVGVYSIAMTLGGFIFILLKSLNTVFAPIISELHATGKHEEMKRIYFAATRWITLLSAPLAVSLTANGNAFLHIFGDEFTEGSTALWIIAAGYLVNVSFGPIGMIAQMTGLEKNLFRYSIITQVVSLLLFWGLIPVFGLIGAAIAICVNNILSNILIARIIKIERDIFIVDRAYLYFCIALGLSILTLRYIINIVNITDTITSIIFTLAGSTMVIGLTLVFNSFLINDLRLLKNVILRKGAN